MKSTTEILELLRTYKAHSAAKYGVKRPVFSALRCRGEQTEHSDVDICYEGDALHSSSRWNVSKRIRKSVGKPGRLDKDTRMYEQPPETTNNKESIYV